MDGMVNYQPARLLLNEDCNHFAYTRSAEEMTPAGVDALVDEYADGTQVTDLLFNVNGLRSSVPSAVKQVFWENFDPDAGDDQPYFAGVPDNERPIIRKWVGNMMLMEQRGIDPYARWLARSRQLGVRGWISVRMNDIHCVDAPGHIMHDRIWSEHPEFWRETSREFESPIDRALDYGHPEVRAHHLAYIREMVERYEMDGLELDFMRQPFNFRAGYEEEGAALMTELVRQVRAAMRARAAVLGRPIRLAARVPSGPDTSRRLGLDAVAWARGGLVDDLFISAVFDTSEPDMPVELWKGLLHGTEVSLAAGLEIRLLPYSKATGRCQTSETVCGAVAGLLDRGADGIYLFNFMDRGAFADPDGKLLYEATHHAGSPDTLAGRPRRHVLTFTDCRAPGEPRRNMLPQPLQRYGYRPSVEFRLPTGPAPQPTQTAEVRLGLELADQPPLFGRYIIEMGRVMRVETEPIDEALAGQLVVRVNGHPCAFARTLTPDVETGATHAYAISAGALHRGDNVIEISNQTESTVQAVWVEIAIGSADL